MPSLKATNCNFTIGSILGKQSQSSPYPLHLMKKIYSLPTFLVMLVFAAMSFSACDIYINDEYDPYYPTGRGDRGRANVISGEWQGDFGMFYTATNPYTGRGVQFDASNTYILFQSDYYYGTSGTGKQIDFYNYGPIRQRYHRFVWEVRNGVLYLSYPGEPALNVAIYDYALNNSYFTGYAGDSRFRFNLRKLNYGLWSNYALTDFDDPYDGWSWNGLRSVQDAAASAQDAAILPNSPQQGVVGGRK